MVRRQATGAAVYFTPEHVAEATKEMVKLNLSVAELEQT